MTPATAARTRYLSVQRRAHFLADAAINHELDLLEIEWATEVREPLKNVRRDVQHEAQRLAFALWVIAKHPVFARRALLRGLLDDPAALQAAAQALVVSG